MPRLIAWAVLGLVVLPGCLYAVAAKVAISAISGVASVVASSKLTSFPSFVPAPVYNAPAMLVRMPTRNVAGANLVRPVDESRPHDEQRGASVLAGHAEQQPFRRELADPVERGRLHRRAARA